MVRFSLLSVVIHPEMIGPIVNLTYNTDSLQVNNNKEINKLYIQMSFK